MKLPLISVLALFPVVALAADAQVARPKATPRPASSPKPTLEDVPYGPDPKQVMDFWRALSSQPTPLVFFIHGGGWRGNDKSKVYTSGLTTYLEAGISVVAINYRFVTQAQGAGVEPPVKWPLQDAARALQFVRSRAAEWNIDKARIAASGGSAGACSSLWLAFHDDMADPRSEDPIARQSTRLFCAGVMGAQTSLDPAQMKEWIPNSTYGGHAFGFNGDKAKGLTAFAQFLANRDAIIPWIREYSPYELVTPDDPPVFLSYGAPPAPGKDQKDPTHSANFGVMLERKLKEADVPCVLTYPGAPGCEQRSIPELLVAHLRGNGTADVPTPTGRAISNGAE